jgi:hypothetical protein
LASRTMKQASVSSAVQAAGSGVASTPFYLGGGGLGTAIISWIFSTPPSRTFTPPNRRRSLSRHSGPDQ